MLLIVSIAVFMFVWSGMIKGCYQKLLEEGDYTREKKSESRKYGSIYWPVVTAVYLGISFLTMRWDITWVIWPCAAIGYGALCSVMKALSKKR